MKEIVYYLFAIVAVLLFIVSIQFKNKKDILLAQSAANFCYGVAYFFLNAYSAVFTSLISSIRAMFFFYYAKDNKTPPMLMLVGFIIAVVIAGILSYSNLYSIIPIAITLTYFITSYFKKEKIIRIGFLICALFWTVYNFHVGAYLALIGNAFEITSGIVSLWRYKNVN